MQQRVNVEFLVKWGILSLKLNHCWESIVLNCKVWGEVIASVPWKTLYIKNGRHHWNNLWKVKREFCLLSVWALVKFTALKEVFDIRFLWIKIVQRLKKEAFLEQKEVQMITWADILENIVKNTNETYFFYIQSRNYTPID